MQVGLLWHDTRSVAEVVPIAAARFEKRAGRPANVCYVHPTALPDGACVVDGVRVRTSSRVLRMHFWVGEEAVG